MAPTRAMTAVLLLLASQVVAAAADKQRVATAVKRQAPDANDKILAGHLAFAPLPAGHGAADNRLFVPAYAQHHDEARDGIAPRWARALDVLGKRTSCPADMNSCGGSGSPNKCCPQGTYCTAVPDSDVGHVACCPNGLTCGGGVGKCPDDATSCAAALGGGCCIPGYVCQGVGCVPKSSATATPALPPTRPRESVTPAPTSVIDGNPTNNNPPWRPISVSDAPVPVPSESTAPPTQTGCPTGFYGCSATHEGGCCRTDRDCHTSSCPPPPPLTTLVSNGATVVVPVVNLPTTPATATCANGWFLCGKDDAVAPGCCPSGYECGTASCFAAAATATTKIPKQAPDQSSATGSAPISSLSWCLLALVFLW
ncbi:hypothetical protein E4U21_003399 [Claviceps maximensis]|nr:hypothetical protein E4U21_003399 [Claviceps maximensis]